MRFFGFAAGVAFAGINGFRARRRRPLAASSAGSSTVSKNEHVWRENLRILVPSSDVEMRSHPSVSSVCIRSFASVCHSAKIKSNDRMAELWGSSMRPSKTGIAHYSKSPQSQHRTIMTAHHGLNITYLQKILVVPCS